MMKKTAMGRTKQTARKAPGDLNDAPGPDMLQGAGASSPPPSSPQLLRKGKKSVSTPAGKKKGGRPAKAAGPFVAGLMEEANDTVKGMSDNLHHISKRAVEEEVDTEERVRIPQPAPKAKARQPGQTLTIGPTFAMLKERSTCPLGQLQAYLTKDITPMVDNILDFTGCAQITDAVLYLMCELPANVRSTIVGLRLTGCHMVTDAGIMFAAEAFRSLVKLFIGGCLKVTETSLVVVVQKCPKLETLEIQGTNVAVLPREMADMILVTDCTPLASPLPSDLKNPPMPTTDMAKVCVVRREGKTTLSVLRLLQGDKEVSVNLPVAFKSNLPCGKATLLNVIECDQILLDVFSHGWGVYVIPSQLSDKTKIDEEAKAIFGVISSVLFKTGGGAFVLLGLHSAQAGIVPMDILRERVQTLADNLLTSLAGKKPATATADPQSLADQMELDDKERKKMYLTALNLSALEVNVDDSAKANLKLKEHLQAQRAKNPESKLFCKGLGNFMEKFPETEGKELKTGAHTLSEASQILLQSPVFNSSLEARGAALTLTKMGKISRYQKPNGDDVYMETSLLCQVLCQLLAGQPKTENQVRELAINDKTMVMTSEELDERASKMKSSVDMMLQTSNDLEVVGVQRFAGQIFIPYSSLLEQADFSLDRFAKTPGSMQATYLFVLPFSVPRQLWWRAVSRLLSLRWPLHLWSHGLVVQYGVSQLLVFCEDDKITLLCQSTKTEGQGEEECVTVMWESVEQYKLILDHVFLQAAIVPEVVCDADKPRPEGISYVITGHKFDIQRKSCTICGENLAIMATLMAADAAVKPAMLTNKVFKLNLFDDANRGGTVQGSNVTLHSGGSLVVNTGLDGVTNRRCTILFNSTGFERLSLYLSSGTGQRNIKFGDKDTISLARKSPVKGESPHVGKPLAGVAINITLSPTIAAEEAELDCVVDCCGEVLAVTTVPRSRYSVGVFSDESYIQQGASQTPQLARDKIQLTVMAQSFMNLGSAKVEKGMRLEAVDRKNPQLLCVATIIDIKYENIGKGGPLLLHFDGWTATFDYWAEMDSSDLHPVGYAAAMGGYKGRSLQKPNGYQKRFDWLTYLQEERVEPVPINFFNAEQLAGPKHVDPMDFAITGIVESLGIASDSNSTSKVECHKLFFRNAAVDLWAKQLQEKQSKITPATASAFLKTNPLPFCLLPAGLDVPLIRYPSMSSMFEAEAQSLHILCPGQENCFHLADHSGLQLSSVTKTYKGLEKYLTQAYMILMASGALTIPLDMNHLCKDVASYLSVDKMPMLEKGFQVLYRMYATMFHFLDLVTSPASKGKKDDGLMFDADLLVKLKKVVEENCKVEHFRQIFSPSPDFSKIQCQGHAQAESGDQGLTGFPTAVFDVGKTGTLRNLYLFRNLLESLPDDFSERLPTLQQLMMSQNKLTGLPSLSGFKSLTHLYLSKNRITSLELTGNLVNTLLVLDVSDNPLGGLPPSLVKMANLTALCADNIGTVKSLDLLLPLKQLEKVYLSSNAISAVPEKFHTCNFTSLTLSAVPLIKSRSSGAEPFTMESLMKSYEQYNAVMELDLKERASLFLMVKGKSQEESIATINTRLIKRFPRLNNGKFPAELLLMKNLARLDLSHQGFESVPDEIVNLTKLKELTLNGCFKLETISALVSKLPLDVLALNDCPSLKTPPKEIVERGFQAIKGYLRRLQMGSVECKRTKLMLVGLGGAGKTSLVRSLRLQQFSMHDAVSESITDGIDICEWDVKIKNEANPLQFSVWDFAGQTVYYNTHQFFMSDRAVYLLLWNIRLGYEHAGLDFWLSSIACHAPNAPVLVVGTHCDKVNRSHIPQAELKRRFPQIRGFYFVSSYSGQGIPALTDDLVGITLTQKYIGEKIPEVWLRLEKELINIRDKKKKALLPWTEMTEAGFKTGIFDNDELIQAVQFLHDLGSVQFFNTEFLRSNVVIIPQWIVDVMSCVVTVHDGPIKDGVLKHEDMEAVWEEYPKALHPWLLRLTEEFDLTFAMADRQANIIPCLLPDTEPNYTWPKVNRDNGEREMKMIYKFDYLPAGLFNRAQVRLQEFSENAVMWKKGSMLRKNQHSALVLQTGNVTVEAKAIGFKPDNTLFLVHEVIECLISESYSGVHYDYFIPCMECQAQLQSEPCMFPRSKVHRAMEFKAPFLQCDSFHIMSIPEIQAIMPPDLNSDFDDHLRRGVNELYSLEEDVVVSAFMCYSQKNVPTLQEEGKVVHPATVLQDLRDAGYKVSFTDDPENANMEALTMSMKAAQVVIIGISDEFLSNKQCHGLIIYARETLKKQILLMTLGKTSDWQKQDINFLLGTEVYVKMQDISRYPFKIKELIAAVQTKAGIRTNETHPDLFISYCWKNSKTAVSMGTKAPPGALGWGDPRQVKKFLQDKGVNCWLDIEQLGQEGFYEDMARGLRTSKAVVAFVSDEYAMSKNCRMEFQFAVESVRLPVIVVTVGTGFAWERSEIGMLAVGHSCTKINLQLENPAGLETVLTEVNKVLAKVKATSSNPAPLSTGDQRKIAFQESMELTQRKFLRQLAQYMHGTGQQEYPHLILVDLIDKVNEGQGQQVASQDTDSSEAEASQEEKADGDKKEDEDKGDVVRETAEQTAEEVSDQYCFRTLCEWEQGWHEVAGSVPFPVDSSEGVLKQIAPYCVRIMAILKHSSLPLPILTLPQGQQLCKNFEEWTAQSSSDFESAYKVLTDLLHKQDKLKTYGGLKRCHVSNGKQLWLCPEHSAKVGNVDAERTPTATAAVPYNLMTGKDVEDEEEVYQVVEEEEEVKAPTPRPEPRTPQTPRTSKTPSGKRTPKTLNRASSRACDLM